MIFHAQPRNWLNKIRVLGLGIASIALAGGLIPVLGVIGFFVVTAALLLADLRMSNGSAPWIESIIGNLFWPLSAGIVGAAMGVQLH